MPYEDKPTLFSDPTGEEKKDFVDVPITTCYLCGKPLGNDWQYHAWQTTGRSIRLISPLCLPCYQRQRLKERPCP